MKKHVTIKDVAKKVNLSVSTVSYVLSGKKRMSEETVKRVLQAVWELEYIPNKIAQSLKNNKIPVIGVLVPDIKNPFFPDLIDFLSNELLEDGFQILVACSNENIDKQKYILHVFLEYRVAGIIAIPTGDERIIKPDFKNLFTDIPLVILDRNIKLNVPKILLNNRNSAKTLTNFLIKKGHKRIGIITPPLYLSIGKERLQGYLDALQENNIQPSRMLIYEGNLFSEAGEQATLYFLNLSKTDRPTAILSCSDTMTFGVLKELKKLGLKIPRDISVASFDDPEYFEILDPPMTCIAQPLHKFVKKAASVMKEMLNGKFINKTFKFEGELRIRGSVDFPLSD